MNRRRSAAAGVAVVAVVGLLALAPGGAVADDYTVPSGGRVSLDTNGGQADDRSVVPTASGNGRLVTFESNATNLVPGDTNNVSDVFVRDTVTGMTFLVSQAPDGSSADGPSRAPVISADGTAIAFVSTASNLVEGDTNGIQDVFVHDLETNTTTRVSVASGGGEAGAPARNPSISADGERVAFDSTAADLVDDDTNGTTDVFVHDLTDGTTVRVSMAANGIEADSFSFAPSISADGTVVAFASGAGNLAEDDTNQANDIFVASLGTGALELISRNPAGAVAGVGGGNGSVQPKISGDGSTVVFLSEAPDLVEGDTNGTTDVFVHDRTTGVTERVSVATDGSQADSFSFSPTITGDGEVVAFASGATNLVPGDTNSLFDIFVHNRRSGVTSRVNVNDSGDQANSFSFAPAISSDGSVVAFYSSASNLVPGDDNFLSDVFVSRLLLCNGVEVDVDLNSGDRPTDGDDVILGTPGDDVIDAGSGNDIVCGGGGNDLIAGGPGDDELNGDGGDDTIAGGPGNDLIDGGDGADAINAQDGDDLVLGGPGDDAIVGGPGLDVLDGGEGNDAVNSDPDDVTIDTEPSETPESSETPETSETPASSESPETLVEENEPEPADESAADESAESGQTSSSEIDGITVPAP